MGIMSTNYNTSEDLEVKDIGALTEAYIYDEISGQSDEVKKAFLESEECAVLEAKGIIGRKTLVKLSKNDDMTRRVTMAAMQLAKEKKDPLWDKLVKNRIKERQLLAAIRKKYANGAKRAAKIGQRDYLKNRMGSKFLKTSDIKHRD